MTMVERVGAAIAAVRLFGRLNDWTEDCVPGLPFEICRHGVGDEPEIVVLERHPEYSQGHLASAVQGARARAAIAAMREPSDKMEDAADSLADWSDHWPAAIGEVWRAMIDAALAEYDAGA